MIFENATIITMNPDRQIVMRGAVAVDDSKITAVGKSDQIVEQYPQKRRINCNGNILLPGLIDTHVHLAQCMLRGISHRLPHGNLSNWLVQLIWPLQGTLL